ncbi:unnamed protein product [Hymenolepis diminuta]|uniref:Uncharacterized protein n=1 Tax=Hymenolepis diminuta TaxID=6216 RepID=A0A564ZB98_HYMDI|nr:unnamed protein product [Hymenolepis diminuta]
MTICGEMKRLGFQSLKGWKMPPPPHDLSEINKQQCVTSCASLPSRELNFRHLF